MRDREERYISDAEIRAFIDDEVFRVQLGNVSSTGAMLGPVRPMRKGDLLTLAHLHLRVLARVVWHNGRQAGLQFERPLSPEDLGLLRLVVTHKRGVWGTSSYHSSAGQGRKSPRA